MNREDIIRMADEAKNQWPIEPDFLERFAALVASAERERIYAEQLELPKPKLTGKFSITEGKFKCTGCTGVWDNRSDAHHHSCKDYQ